MKIIEALKQIKYLTKKCEDIQQKLAIHSADMEYENPPFPDMKAKVSEWVQSHGDIVKEIGKLKFRVQKTNVLTSVSVPLDGITVTKTIYEWIQRRKDLSKLELNAWEKLTDRNLKDQNYQQTTGQQSLLKMRRYYDPSEKEKRVLQLKAEPVCIDTVLEITNCTTDLLE